MTRIALPTNCPDCGGSLREVTLFGRIAQPGNPDAAVVHYTDAEATPSFWQAKFEVQGDVHSMMCHACGRLFLYGVPKAALDLSEEIAEEFNCLQCGTQIEAAQSSCPKCGWSYNESLDSH